MPPPTLSITAGDPATVSDVSTLPGGVGIGSAVPTLPSSRIWRARAEGNPGRVRRNLSIALRLAPSEVAVGRSMATIARAGRSVPEPALE